MSDITVIGLGSMGSALARALVKAEHSVTVWNRSLEQMDCIIALGANGVRAILSSPPRLP